MKKLFIFISLLLISNTALAISLGDLKKTLENATEEIKKEIDNNNNQSSEKKKTQSDSISSNSNKKKVEKNSNPDVIDNKFLRTAYFCPSSNSGLTRSSIIYNSKENKKPLPNQRCRGSVKYKEFKDIKFKQDLKWCYAIRKGNWNPEIGYYFKDQNTGKNTCSILLDDYFSKDSFLNIGLLNLDANTGIFDVQNMISEQKGKKDENEKDLQVKLQLIFGLVSEDQYKTSVASTQKKENLSSLLKVDLFGIKLGDQISNYKLINKQLEPNWSYYLYPSTEEYISDKGVLINVFTFGGNGFKKKDQYDGKFHAIYNSLGGYKKKGYSEMMTMISKYDHQYIEPVRSNKNFEDYIVKFDPITKQVLAVMAKQITTSKEECELSGMIEWRKKFGNYFVKKMSENGLITQYENRTILGIFDKQPNHSSQVSNVIAGFGQICADNGMFGKDKWIYLINLADEPEYLDNLYSILFSEKN